MTDITEKKCITPKFRVSYPHVFKPQAFKGSSDAKYSIEMRFDDDVDLKVLKKAAMAAALEKWGAKEKIPKRIVWPWKNGEEKAEENPEYEGVIYCRASSKSQPDIVGRDGETQLTQVADFYPGCYARASLIAFAWENHGKSGISFALINLQKIADGEPLGGRKKASAEFSAIEDDDEDWSDFEDDDDF